MIYRNFHTDEEIYTDDLRMFKLPNAGIIMSGISPNTAESFYYWLVVAQLIMDEWNLTALGCLDSQQADIAEFPRLPENWYV